LAHLPQEPVPGGLGVEPIGLSHVLSARGVDSLDADMQHARHELAATLERRLPRLADVSVGTVAVRRSQKFRQTLGGS